MATDCHSLYCEKCNYTCTTSFLLKQHISTKKHKQASAEITENNNEVCDLKCNICKKIYATRAGLWKHKKTCVVKEKFTELSQEKFTELITQLVKANIDLQTMLAEQNEQHNLQISQLIPKIGNTTNNNTTNNNQTFNLEMFLNVYCKDAMTMDDFVKTIEVTREHMFFSKEHGFVDGLNNIVNEKYNQLPVSERPMHATDKKREVIYVKNRIEGTDDTEWNTGRPR